MRYLIASLLQPASDQLLRLTYRQVFGRDCRIKTLHLTFIPPFTTTQPDLIQSCLALPFEPSTYTTAAPGLFTHHHRSILYCPLTPQEPLKDYFNILLPQVRPHLTFAATDFPAGTIPDFLPHLTLDYHFLGELSSSFPPTSLTLTPPQLLFESASGIWQPYVT